MKQAVVTEPGKLEFRDVSEPICHWGEVMMEVKVIGVCGSDIHVWHGKHPFTSYPVVQGHEFSGKVVKVGDGVKNIKKGMKITALPQVVCGNCGPCRSGLFNVCEHLAVRGFQATGCASDRYVVPAGSVIPIPDSMTFEQGALVEPLACGAHSTSLAGDLRGKNVLVVGAAAIGNLVAQAARCRGAKKILIGNRSGGRKLKVAEECGLTNTFYIKNESIPDAVKRVFGDEGYQVAIECAGAKEIPKIACETVNKGGIIIVLGVAEGDTPIPMAILNEHQLTIRGSMMYQHTDYAQAVEWIAGGQVITDPLVSKQFKFDKYLDAYKYIDEHSKDIMKVMVTLGK
jgi:2-desacetyl-2-hydroxyethyl bacteriochlorophyllide A dehydrogenase